jgi:ABC-type multidrug transport system ATPase subunit
VSLNFGKHAALRGIRIQCRAGALTCLVGPNGAGKSTALAIAAGLLRPESGSVAIDGRAIVPFSHTPGVTYLPQSSFFPAPLTAAEVIEFAIEVSGAGGKQCEDVLEVTGIEEILGRKVGELSGGWVRRLGLAVALIQPSQVVLLDEPLVGLDPETLERLLEHVAHLAADGSTVVMATQEFEVIDALAPYVAVLDDGRVAGFFEPRSGRARDLYRMALMPPRAHAQTRIANAR